MKHIKLRISGRVQGVFFRASTADEARRLGITGFVRNEPDGSVYAEAEGEEKQLQEFVAWCHIGPPRAAVTQCIVTEGELQNFSTFKIER